MHKPEGSSLLQTQCMIFLSYKTSQFATMFNPKDLEEAVQHIYERYPDKVLLGIGISKGANLILRYAGMNP